jgi:hypothetical protein
MRDDAVSARELRDHGSGNRVGLDPLSRLTDRCNMIDIHGQSGHAALPPATSCFKILSPLRQNIQKIYICRPALLAISDNFVMQLPALTAQGVSDIVTSIFSGGRHMFRVPRFCVLLFSLLIFLRAASAQETKTVSAEGVAAIQQGAVDIARDAAIEDAQKRAVEQAVGIMIDSQTQVENYQLISDKISSQIKGYIVRYIVIGETQEGSILRVRITAEVSLGKLSDDLSAISILMSQMHKPRTMVMIAEQNIGRDVYAWWTGSRGETDISVAENAFMDKFTEQGFELIDHRVAAKEITVTSPYTLQDITAVQARAFGNQADAEMVIIGKAVAKLSGEVGGGMKSVQADLTAKAVRTDTGQVIATTASHAAAVHITEISAGTEALKKAANQAAEDMITKIIAVYSKEAGGTRPVAITITGLTKGQFVKFKEMLRSQVRGIKDLHERSFLGTTAKISVDCKTSAQALSDDLMLRDFGAFTVEVVNATANSLELKVAPK